MKITLEPTKQIARFEGTKSVRVWQGTTEEGTDVLAVVLCICGPREPYEQVGRLGRQIRESLLAEPEDEIFLFGLSYPSDPGTSLEGEQISKAKRKDGA